MKVGKIIPYVFSGLTVIFVYGMIMGYFFLGYVYFFGEDSTKEIYRKLQSHEAVDLTRYKYKKLRHLVSLSKEKGRLYNQRVREYKKDIKQHNLLRVLFEGENFDSGLGFIDCEALDIIPGEKVGIKCSSVLDSTVVSYVNNSCYALFYDEEGLYPDELDELGGNIVCTPMASIGQALSDRCEPFGTSITCLSVPKPPESIKTYTLQEETLKKINNIIYLRLNEKFNGSCGNDCSGHISGYNWAKKKKIIKAEDCTGKSPSFVDGCLTYIKEL